MVSGAARGDLVEQMHGSADDARRDYAVALALGEMFSGIADQHEYYTEEVWEMMARMLFEFASHKSSKVREVTAHQLYNLAFSFRPERTPRQTQALEFLQKLAKDSDETVRKVAELVLSDLAEGGCLT